jgi:hypothetical protein
VKIKIKGKTGDSWSSDMAIDNFSITADDDSSLSIESEILNAFQLYPNPSSMGEIKLKMPLGIDAFTVSISNALGQKIYNEKVKSIYNQVHQINTSNLKTGIYFVTVETEEGKASKKMLIQSN